MPLRYFPFRRLAPTAVPPFSRRNYQWELTSAFFIPVAMACIEGEVLGVIASKSFGAGALAISALVAAKPLANITSVLWTRLVHGRDRVRFVVTLQSLVLLCVLAIAAAPFNDFGVAILILGVFAARSCFTGVLTARADLWRANYPRQIRGKVTGNLTIIMTLSLGLTALLIAAAMDLTHSDAPGAAPAHTHRIAYLLCAAIASIGIWAFAHVRWRGRAVQLKSERHHLADSNNSPPGAGAMIGVLKTDRAYRRYMIAQFILGMPNIAAIPIFIVAMERQFSLSYLPSILLTQVIPILVPIFFIPVWARLFDRTHIVHFRSYHSWSFVAANLLMGLAFLLDSQALLYASRFMLGIAFAGGMLAWQLGHHDYAPRELAHIYMGIHVTLTGVRGVVAPFIGTLLYSGISLTFLDESLVWHGVGGWAFILLSAVSTIGALMFVRLHLETRRIEPFQDRHAG